LQSHLEARTIKGNLAEEIHYYSTTKEVVEKRYYIIIKRIVGIFFGSLNQKVGVLTMSIIKKFVLYVLQPHQRNCITIKSRIQILWLIFI